MTEKISNYKKIIEEEIELLGYTSLRYSVFQGEKNYSEYQVRIEYTENDYEVYLTGERASVYGKRKYNDFFSAYKDFMYRIQSQVITNRKHVKNGEPPEYPCSLWEK